MLTVTLLTVPAQPLATCFANPIRCICISCTEPQNRLFIWGQSNLTLNHSAKENDDMKPNMGSADRIIRLIAGVVIIGIGIYQASWWGVVGVVPLITASIGWCPAYTPLGISTKSATSEGDSQHQVV